MQGYEPFTYGDRIADIYDHVYGNMRPPDEQIDLLAELAGAGPALELGIGTGRVALPLAARGVEVHGIDASPKMVAKLREKAGGATIPITIGDFASFELGREFSLVFVGFNTFYGLLTQEEQIACFRAVSEHLTTDGVFLIEAFVPDLARFDRNQRTATDEMTTDSLIVESSIHDPTNQRVDSHQVLLTDGEPPRLFPVSLRYAWPSELDLMARLAGLRLRHRWGDWDRRSFDGSSTKHISVWGRGGA
jgi:SAM-dependent methyltransferase